MIGSGRLPLNRAVLEAVLTHFPGRASRGPSGSFKPITPRNLGTLKSAMSAWSKMLPPTNFPPDYMVVAESY